MKIAILVLLAAASSFAQQKAWRQILDERLPYFGENNWIVVADSAFPLRSSLGIETIISNDSHVNTVRHVLDLLSKQVHVRPVVHTDLELEHVAEQDAPGISAYRQLLSGLFEKFFAEPPAKADLSRPHDPARSTRQRRRECPDYQDEHGPAVHSGLLRTQGRLLVRRRGKTPSRVNSLDYFINSASLSFTAAPQMSYPLACGCRLSARNASGRNAPFSSRNLAPMSM